MRSLGPGLAVGLALLALTAPPVMADVGFSDMKLAYQPNQSGEAQLNVVDLTGMVAGDERVDFIELDFGAPSNEPMTVESDPMADFGCQKGEEFGRAIAVCRFGNFQVGGTHVGGLNPGATFKITVTLPAAYPANGGGFVIGRNDESNNDSGMVQVAGPAPIMPPPPPPPAASADLHVRTHGFSALGSLPVSSVASPRFFLPGFFSLTNDGPDTAARPALLLSAAPAPAGTRFQQPREDVRGGGGPDSRPAECSSSGAGAVCNYDALIAGESSSVQFAIEIRQPGQIDVTAMAFSGTPDPGRLPNLAGISVEVEAFSNSTVEPPGFGKVRLFEGLAPNASRVAVGVAQERGGSRVGFARSSTGSVAVSRGRAAATGCLWLVRKSIRFRREAGRRCDEPRYLTARVRRGRWKLRLRKPLPPGRYTVLTRAITRDGLIESSVHKKLGNLRRFRAR